MDYFGEAVSYVLGVASGEVEETRSLASSSTYASSESLQDVASVPDDIDFPERLQQLADSPHLFRQGSGRRIEWTPLRVDHAKYILEVCPSLARLRYELCPKKLTEDDFWSTYFILFESLLSEHLRIPVAHVDLTFTSPRSAAQAKWSFYDDEAAGEWVCPTCSSHNVSALCEMCPTADA